MAFQPSSFQSGGSFITNLSGFQKNTQQLGDFFAGRATEKNVSQALSEVQARDEEGKPVLEQRGTFRTADKAFNNASLAAYVAANKTDVIDSVRRIKAENEANPDGLRASLEGYKQGLSDVAEPARLEIEALFDRQASNAQFEVDETFKGLNLAKDLDESNQGISTQQQELKKAIRNGDSDGAAAFIESITAAVQSNIYSADVAEEIVANTMKMAFMENESAGAINHIQNGERFEAAQEIERLRLATPPPGISIEEWDKHLDGVVREGADLNAQRKIIKEEQQKVFEVENTFKLNDLTELTEQGGVSREDLSEAFESGVIPSANELRKLDNIRIEALKTGQEKVKIKSRLAGKNGEVLDAKAVNEFYLDNISELSGAEKALYVDSMKMVPNALRAEVDTKLLSGDPDLVVQAGALIDAIDQVPGLQDPFTPTNRAFADWVVKLSQNMTPQEAVQQAEALTDPRNKNRIEARQVEFTEMQKGFNSRDFSVDDVIERGFFNINVPPSELDKANMQLEYKDVVEAHFLAGMPIADAEERAAKIVQRNWKEQTFLGRTEAFKYPLADYYSVEGSVDYAEKQLLTDVKTNNVFPEEVTRDEIFLLSDKRTADEAALGQPTYLIYAVQNGQFINTGQRFKPDVKAAQDARDKRLKALRGSGTVEVPEFKSL